MRILITGANGFLGRTFKEYFRGKGHEVRVHSFLKSKEIRDVDKYDAVLHCAVDYNNNFDAFVNNLSMFKQVKDFCGDHTLLINFCSGAALRRSPRTAVLYGMESDIWYIVPEDFYGRAKNLIAREMQDPSLGKRVNLRLFGCFGRYEKSNRFVTRSMNNLLKGCHIEVSDHKKLMDFFYAKDLCRVVEFFIKFSWLDFIKEDINMVYNKPKQTLLNMAEHIRQVSGSSLSILSQNENQQQYTGDDTKLASLQIQLLGLHQGIKDMWEHKKNEVERR